MNRIIRFRGMSIEENYPGFYFGSLGIIRDFGRAYCTIYDEYVPNRIYKKVDSKTVGQFIGIKDIKEREIYEGDILKVTKNSRGDFKIGDTFEVKYSNDCAAFYMTPFDKNTTQKEDIIYAISKNRIEEFGITVIGNIYSGTEEIKNT